MSSENPRSGESDYTAISIQDMKDASPTSGFVGLDPKDEKKRLNQQLESTEIIVGDYEKKARLLKRISGGTFGEVYLGELLNEQISVAVKLEPQNSWIQPTVMNEGNVYRKLGYNVDRIPVLYWFGFYGSNMAYAGMILELLGDNLYHLWLKQDQEFSWKTMLMLIDETLTCLETIHSKGFVHRDISPNNFAISSQPSNNSKIYIFDFGHAQFVQRTLNRSYSQLSSLNKSLRVAGTPRFASTFNHKGQIPSFRDDLESLGYVWVYFLKGRLPWQGVRAASHEEKLHIIGRSKEEVSLEELCENLPPEFVAFFTYVRKLSMFEKANFAEVKAMFANLASQKGVVYDYKYDWS